MIQVTGNFIMIKQANCEYQKTHYFKKYKLSRLNKICCANPPTIYIKPYNSIIAIYDGHCLIIYHNTSSFGN